MCHKILDLILIDAINVSNKFLGLIKVSFTYFILWCLLEKPFRSQNIADMESATNFPHFNLRAVAKISL